MNYKIFFQYSTFCRLPSLIIAAFISVSAHCAMQHKSQATHKTNPTPSKTKNNKNGQELTTH